MGKIINKNFIQVPIRVIPIIVIVNVFLIVEVILLIIQNRELRTKYDESMRPPELLKIDDNVKPIRGLTIDGDSVEITYNGVQERYILLIFSTRCPICLKNLPNWVSIMESNNDNINQIIGISISKAESTLQYLKDKQIKFPTIFTVDTSVQRTYRLFVVPLTILIKKGGIVEKVIPGEITAEQLADFRKVFNAEKAL